MESLKKVVGATGIGRKQQLSGQEPVSGVEGKGTAGEPFDAGNEEGNENLGGKAPQETKSDVKASGQEPVSGVQGAGTAGEPFDAGNLGDKADLAGKAPQRTDLVNESTTNGSLQTDGQTGTQTSVTQEAPRLEKKPTIGSSRWFANPFAKQSNTFEGPEIDPFAGPAASTTEASTTAESEKPVGQDEMPGRPPNHLGEDVPPGQDTIVVEPIQDPAFTATGNMPNHLRDDVPPANGIPMDKGKGKAKMSPEQVEQHESRPDFPPHRTESSSISTRRESVSTEYTIGTRVTYSTAATGTSIAGSSRRASRAVHIVTSQGKPITAGGVPLGLPAMEERERRLSFSVPEEDDLPPEFRVTRFSNEFEGSKHHDFANSTPKATAEPEKKVSNTGRDTAPSKPQANDSKTSGDNLRRRSSIIHRAKDFGRRMRHSIAK